MGQVKRGAVWRQKPLGLPAENRLGQDSQGTYSCWRHEKQCHIKAQVFCFLLFVSVTLNTLVNTRRRQHQYPGIFSGLSFANTSSDKESVPPAELQPSPESSPEPPSLSGHHHLADESTSTRAVLRATQHWQADAHRPGTSFMSRTLRARRRERRPPESTAFAPNVFTPTADISAVSH